MERKNRFLYNVLLNTLLIVGYFLIYVVNIEELVYPNQNIETKSKVDFVYQQF